VQQNIVTLFAERDNMVDDLITKKELLQITGISYGQLYRWKRKGLIPDEWFIHGASFTGQETLFPRGQILARIAQIINLKSDVSLDNLADILSPELSETTITGDEAVKVGVISLAALDFVKSLQDGNDITTFEQLLTAYIIHEQFRIGDITRDECRLIYETTAAQAINICSSHCDYVVLRKMGISICIVTDSSKVWCDIDTRIIKIINIPNSVQSLKLMLNSGVKNERE
jgi:DNA-binding transcriptional MerR regulator